MSSSSTESPSSRRECVVGRVVAVWRYPVKSMGAEPVNEANLSWHGLAGDRRWAFVRKDQQRNGFPWLTIRERPDMWLYRPRLLDNTLPDKSDVQVLTPSGREFDITDPALAMELGDGVRLLKQNRGVFDTLPVSLITTQTVAALGTHTDRALDALRFRPNFLIEATSELPYAEDKWVGKAVRIGSAQVRIDQRDQRCMVVNVDPETTERDPKVLRAIGRERQACLGVYGQTMEPGQVVIGDSVVLQELA